MPDKDDNWAGPGFTRRNEESAKEPKLRVTPKPEPKDDDEDPEAWVWK